MGIGRAERTGWAVVLIWLSISGVVGALAWGLFGYGSFQDRLADMSRTAIPGRIAVDVHAPTTLTVFYEDPRADARFVVRASGSSTLVDQTVQLNVTAPSGEPVEVAPYERDLRFHHDGRVVTAMATIDASVAGVYTVETTGEAPSAARISVGHVVDAGVIATLVGVIGLFVVSLAGLAIAIVMITVRRRKTGAVEGGRPLVGA